MPRLPPPLIREVRRAYRARLLGGERRILLAVSGGPDSLALLDASAELATREGLHFEVAHVDHGVRAASAAEAAWVEGQAAERGIRAHRVGLALAEGPGFEARARAAREEVLEALRVEADLDVIATGHTASDQAETLLMRLARGAALRGAAGILGRKGRLVRPLLGVTRQEVLAHLHARGLAALVDPMNADPAFLRCRIRHRMLPVLDGVTDAGVARRLARFSTLAGEDDAYLQTQAVAALDRLGLEEGTWDRVGLRALAGPLRRRALHALVERVAGPLGGERLEAALEVLETGGRCELRGGWALACEGGRVRLLAGGEAGQPGSHRTPPPSGHEQH